MRFVKSPAIWCLAIAVLFAMSQLLLLDTSRFLSWDEAVYVSEVSPFGRAVGMGAHRARGITLIVAPVTMLTDSMVVLRGYLAVVSGSALFGAYVVWCRSIGWAAPMAMGLFATSWIAVFYGSSVYPNFYTAVIAVGALGIAAAPTEKLSRGHLVLLGALVAAATLIRPLDGLILVVCLGITGVVLARDRIRPLLVSAVSGLAAGALPWAIEAWARFGGPLARLEASGEIVGGGFHNNITEYLQILDGTGSFNPAAGFWLALLLILGLMAVFSPDPLERRSGLVSLLSALLFVGPYVFATEPVLERFMLPGLALLVIASAIGLAALAAKLVTRPVWAAVLGLGVLAAVSWNLPALAQWDDRQSGNAQTALQLGQAVREQAAGEDCFVLSPANHPAVAFAAGCADSWSLGESLSGNLRRLDEARSAGNVPFVVTLSESPGELVGEGWRCEPIETLADRGWQLCATPEG